MPPSGRLVRKWGRFTERELYAVGAALSMQLRHMNAKSRHSVYVKRMMMATRREMKLRRFEAFR